MKERGRSQSMWAYWHIRESKESNNRRDGEDSSVLLWEGGKQFLHSSLLPRSSSCAGSPPSAAFWNNTKDRAMQERTQERTQEMERWLCVCVTGLHVELCVEDPELLSALTRWTLARPVGMEMDARFLFAQWTAASKQTSSCFLSTLSVAGRVRRL